ncbi:hypothetical protein, partial [Streptococcus pseudopneumoniae]
YSFFHQQASKLEKVLKFYHARSHDNAPIFDFKQLDGKLCQNKKQGGYGAYYSLFSWFVK